MATIEGMNTPDASSTLAELEDVELVEDSVDSVSYFLNYFALYIRFPFFGSATHSYYTLFVLSQIVAESAPFLVDHPCSFEVYCTLFL